MAEALKVNSALQELNILFNNISDEGAEALAEALRVNTALQELNLGFNDISGKGAKVLAEAMKVNSALKELKLDGNSKISSNVIQQIRREMRNTLSISL